VKNIAAQPGHQDHVLALCHMLSNRIGKAFISELAKHEITVAEWRVMLTLALHEKASGREVASRWAMDKMAVSRAVASLEQRALVRRQQSKADRRSFDLTLTKTGSSMYRKILPVANKRYHQLTAGLERSEITRLRQLLIKAIIHVDAVLD
jgi:DNA-binding MarR family transcriptional regulator